MKLLARWRRFGWTGFVAALAVTLPALLASSPARAQDRSDEVQFNAVVQTGPSYPLGRLIPVQLRIANRSARDIDGTLEIKDLSTPAGPIDVVRPAFVPAHSRTTLDLLVQLPEPPPRDRQGNFRPAAQVVLWSASHTRLGNPDALMAKPDSWDEGPGREASGLPGVLMAISVRSPEDSNPAYASDPYDAGELASALTTVLPYSVTPASFEADELFRRVEAYDAVRLIVLDDNALGQMDAAQREAVLRQVRNGACLILAEPTPGLHSSWIADLLPMDAVNVRLSKSIETREFGRLPMPQAHKEYECELRTDHARGAVVAVATNDHGAVAAYREVGLGRVVMVGCAVNALTAYDSNVLRMWTTLLGTNRPTFHDYEAIVEPPALREQLPSMIGATAPPWKTAAAIVAGYVAAVALVLTFSGARWRPVAFGISAVLAMIVAGGVVTMASYKTSSVPLMAATVNVVDVIGNVARSDSLVTFFGERGDLAVQAKPGTILSPVVVSSVAGSEIGPRLTMFPARLEGLSASVGKLNTVVRAQSTATLPTPQPVSATLRFDAQGATLDVTGLNQPLEAPRLVSNTGVVFPLQGDTQRVGRRNPAGVWSDGSGMIASEQSKLRDQLVLSAEGAGRPSTTGRAPHDVTYKLVGFGDPATLGIDPGLELPDVDLHKEATLVRIPVSIAPAPAGTEVRIDPGFTQIRRESLANNVPINPQTGLWHDVSQSGAWLVAIAPPDELGKFAPRTLTLEIDLRGSGYDIAVRRGQIVNGKSRLNPAGETVLQWANASGPQQATIELTPQDIDANGWAWVLLTVDETQAMSFSPEARTPWHITRFDATLTGTVTGPAEPVKETWERDSRPRNPTPQKPAPKPNNNKKPTAKPSADDDDDND